MPYEPWFHQRWNSGPCRDRTYDHQINRQVRPPLSAIEQEQASVTSGKLLASRFCSVLPILPARYRIITRGAPSDGLRVGSGH
jgi:hypothetical protein